MLSAPFLKLFLTAINRCSNGTHKCVLNSCILCIYFPFHKALLGKETLLIANGKIKLRAPYVYQNVLPEIQRIFSLQHQMMSMES
jgi:hypothetical protein